MLKIKCGKYRHRGYTITNLGWHPPDKCIWWEAVSDETGCADFRGSTLSGVVTQIDEDLDCSQHEGGNL